MKQNFYDLQFLQDAHILGRILSDFRVNPNNIEAALKIYNDIRRPFGNSVVERSRMTGFMYEFDVEGFQHSEDLSEEDGVTRMMDHIHWTVRNGNIERKRREILHEVRMMLMDMMDLTHIFTKMDEELKRSMEAKGTGEKEGQKSEWDRDW